MGRVDVVARPDAHHRYRRRTHLADDVLPKDRADILLYVLERAFSPCNKWWSVELAPDSTTGMPYHQREDVVASIGFRTIAHMLAPSFRQQGWGRRRRGDSTRRPFAAMRIGLAL